MNRKMSMVLFVACALSAFPALAGDYSTCFGTRAANYYRGNLNSDLNDFGMFFHDAKNTGCNATTVSQRMRSKLTAMNNASGAWTGFLAGGSMGLAMATGLELGGRVGTGTNQVSVSELELLDKAIYTAGEAYQFTKGVSGDECGINFVATAGMPAGEEVWRRANNCMDDHAIGAWAYGWKAAYYAKTGRPYSTPQSATLARVQAALSEADSICVHNPNAARDTSANKRGECNSTISALSVTGPSELVSLSHGSQSPAYGIGLMTSISTAFTGLDVAGTPVDIMASLTADQRKAAEYLLFEGRKKSVGGNYSSTDCFNMQGATTVAPYVYGANADLVKPWHCHDNIFDYHADMFAVKEFYTRYGFSTSLAVTGHSYATADFNESRFYGNEFVDNVTAAGTLADQFFGPGRRAVYRVLSGDWVNASGRPSTGLYSRGEYKMNMAVSDWTPPSIHYLLATNGGGSTVSSTGTWSDSNARWIMMDLNGGDLNSGDPVALRTPSGYYLSAVNGGGGAVNASATQPITWERFTIVLRDYPYTGRIGTGNRFALGTYDGTHYLRLVGTDVDATSVWVSDMYPSYETFLYSNREW